MLQRKQLCTVPKAVLCKAPFCLENRDLGTISRLRPAQTGVAANSGVCDNLSQKQMEHFKMILR